MKKQLGVIALFAAVSLAATGTASAKCVKWKKVCHPVYKHKTVWKTCHDKHGYPYKCKRTIKIKVGHTCKNKCIRWKKVKKWVPAY